MDFSNAALLIVVVFGLTELAKSVLPSNVTGKSWAVVLINLALAIGGVYLLGSTVWAHEQVIGGHALDTLGGGDKLLVGLMLGGGAAFLNRGIGAVMNIGQNQPSSSDNAQAQ